MLLCSPTTGIYNILATSTKIVPEPGTGAVVAKMPSCSWVYHRLKSTKIYSVMSETTKSMNLWDNNAGKLAVMMLTLIQKIDLSDNFGYIWEGNTIGITNKQKQGREIKANITDCGIISII